MAIRGHSSFVVRTSPVGVVRGLQGRSKMEKRHGQDAEAMLSQPATKIFLKTTEPTAAMWVSKAIGQVEIAQADGIEQAGHAGIPN